jgi:hypothetical protein
VSATAEASVAFPLPASGLVPLSAILATALVGQELVPGFPGWCEGVCYEVTAVLERTAALKPDDCWADSLLKRHDQVFVDEATLCWRPKPEERTSLPRWWAEDREVQQARAAYLAEQREAGANGASWRYGRDAFPKAPRLSDRVCSRDGCATRLHPANQTGECKRCQHKCPKCGEAKARLAAACRNCIGQGGRPPGAATLAERLCAGCGNQLGGAAKGDRCLACRKRCACGQLKSPEAARCRACAARSATARTVAPRPAVAIPIDARKPAVPESVEEGEEPGGAGDATSPASPTLDELPDYVGCLLEQIEKLAEQVREQGVELTALREREAAWRDVERRIQAVVARSAGRA